MAPTRPDFDDEEVVAAVPPPPPSRSIGGLLADVTHETTVLLRQELALAKTELVEQAVRAASGAGLLAGAGLIAHAALLVLLAAAVLGLTRVFEPWLAALIVGGAALFVALVLGLVGRSRLRSARFVPERTLHSLKRDARWVGDRTS